MIGFCAVDLASSDNVLARSQDHPRTAHYSTVDGMDGSVGRWVGGSVGRWVGGSVDRWIGGSVDRWVGGSVGRWIGGSMYQWIGRVLLIGYY